MRKNVEVPKDKMKKLVDEFYSYFVDGYAFEEFLIVYLEKIGLDEVTVIQGYYIEEVKSGTDYIGNNEYGIDIDDPYEGLFKERTHRYKYTINHTKKIGYSLEDTKILFQSCVECDYVDPITMLLGYGRVEDPGSWVGDIIGVADELPDGYTLMEEVTLNWGG